MRTLVALGIGVGVIAVTYGIGCWLLGEWPWAFWSERVPPVYDGKVPYAEWAATMERGRRIQEEEEA